MSYTKTTWATGDVITAEKLNNAEDGIAANDTALAGKQATLVSGTNIKTINNESILGSGNIAISGGSSGTMVVTYDDTEDTIDKTYQQLLTAYQNNILPVLYMQNDAYTDGEAYYIAPCLAIYDYAEQIGADPTYHARFIYYAVTAGNVQNIDFVAESATDKMRPDTIIL